MNHFCAVLLFLLLFHFPVLAQGPQSETHEFNPETPIPGEGEMISLMTSNGTPFQAYEVLSKTQSESSLLLVHEWWGLNEHMKATADQFALLGYNALAVDLFDGSVTDNPDEAAKLIDQVKPDTAREKLDAALEYLAARSAKIGVIGWCFGGGWALRASLSKPERVNATVIYYGELVNEPEQLKKLKGPLLGIFAQKDKWIIPQWVDAFKTALEQSGVVHEIYSYDADHAFANPSGKRFNEAAYRDAWAKTLEFLEKKLRKSR